VTSQERSAASAALQTVAPGATKPLYGTSTHKERRKSTVTLIGVLIKEL